MAKKVRLDNGYMNAFMPVRRGRSLNYSAEMMGGGNYLSQPQLQSLYMHNGFARIICDSVAEEMTRAGFEIKSKNDALTEDDIDTIKSRLEELDAVKHFNESLKWSGAFGGGLVVLGLDDGNKDMAVELNEESITRVDFMRVYDRFDAIPESRYDDPTNEKYGKVAVWKITPRQMGGSYLVHETRTLWFDGESVPNDIRSENDGWGAARLQTCLVQLVRMDSAHKLALLLMDRMQQAVHKIPNLSEMVGDAEGEAAVAKRVQVVDMVRGALNTIIIDALEEYQITSLSISGVNDLLDRFAEALSAVSRVPVFILMGRTVGGLGGNGESSKEGWYAQVEAWQNDKLRKPLDRLISFILLEMSKGKTDGGSYTLEFNPLSAPSDKDQAEIDYKKEQAKKAKADTLNVYVTAGAMDQDEMREEIREEYNLIGTAPEPEPEPLENVVLNPGQKIAPNLPGHNNPALPVGKKK